MVQLTEVVDEHFQEGQPGPEDEDDADYTDTGMLRSHYIFFLATRTPKKNFLPNLGCSNFAIPRL